MSTGSTFYIKQNDTLPDCQETLLLGDAILDLTAATSVIFHLRNVLDNSTKVNAAASIVDADGGVVKYVWNSTDTNTAGEFKREWQVTFAAGKILTVPNDEVGYQVMIIDDIV